MPKPNPLRQVDGYSPDMTGPLRALPWADGALCAQTDPDLWFELSTDRYISKPNGTRETAAKDICGRCPVRQECLDYAMADPMLQGIWGGLTQREREQARRRAREAS